MGAKKSRGKLPRGEKCCRNFRGVIQNIQDPRHPPCPGSTIRPSRLHCPCCINNRSNALLFFSGISMFSLCSRLSRKRNVSRPETIPETPVFCPLSGSDPLTGGAPFRDTEPGVLNEFTFCSPTSCAVLLFPPQYRGEHSVNIFLCPKSHIYICRVDTSFRMVPDSFPHILN